MLRALRFLDTLLQREDLQKAAFLKDLAQLWPRWVPSRHPCTSALVDHSMKTPSAVNAVLLGLPQDGMDHLVWLASSRHCLRVSCCQGLAAGADCQAAQTTVSRAINSSHLAALIGQFLLFELLWDCLQV